MLSFLNFSRTIRTVSLLSNGRAAWATAAVGPRSNGSRASSCWMAMRSELPANGERERSPDKRPGERAAAQSTACGGPSSDNTSLWTNHKLVGGLASDTREASCWAILQRQRCDTCTRRFGLSTKVPDTTAPPDPASPHLTPLHPTTHTQTHT